MIYLYFGKPGSGKSTYAAYLAKKFLKQKKTVFSNTEIAGTIKFNPKNIGLYDISNAEIIWDEAGQDLNSRNWDKRQKEKRDPSDKNSRSYGDDLYWFFTMHRHYNLNIHLFLQSYTRLDVFIREIVGRMYLIEKSLLPFHVRIRRINMKVGIDKDTKQIIEQYNFIPLIGTKRIFAPFTWDMFCTVDKDRELPPLPDDLRIKWGEYDLNPFRRYYNRLKAFTRTFPARLMVYTLKIKNNALKPSKRFKKQKEGSDIKR